MTESRDISPTIIAQVDIDKGLQRPLRAADVRSLDTQALPMYGQDPEVSRRALSLLMQGLDEKEEARKKFEREGTRFLDLSAPDYISAEKADELYGDKEPIFSLISVDTEDGIEHIWGVREVVRGKHAKPSVTITKLDSETNRFLPYTRWQIGTGNGMPLSAETSKGEVKGFNASINERTGELCLKPEGYTRLYVVSDSAAIVDRPVGPRHRGALKDTVSFRSQPPRHRQAIKK